MTTCNQPINPPYYRLLLMVSTVFCTTLFSPTPFAKDVSPVKQEATAEFFRSEVSYNIPDVTVVRQDGKKLSFLKELDDGRPVMLNFIFASCSAICPMLSHMFAKVETELHKGNKTIHLVSVSIDPENDTPSKLLDYANKLKAGADWDHYTGTQAVSVAIQKAFNVYRGDKMNHAPVTFIRAKPGQPWVRLEGFLSPSTLIQEYDKLMPITKH